MVRKWAVVGENRWLVVKTGGWWCKNSWWYKNRQWRKEVVSGVKTGGGGEKMGSCW